VNLRALPLDRHFDTGNEGHALCRSGLGRRRQAGNIVVIGQRQQFNAISGSTAHHIGRREKAIRSSGVTMKIDVGHRSDG
jgi:hypothetical protein